MDFKYVNSKGVEISLSDRPYVMQDGNLLDYAWNYEIVNGNTNRIGNVKRGAGERSFQLALLPESGTYQEKMQKLKEHATKLLEVVDYDVINGKDGKIVTDTGYFFPCRLFSSTKSDWLKAIPLCYNQFTAVSTENAWIKPVKKSFFGSEVLYSIGLDYPFDYEYDYTAGSATEQNWNLGNLEPADFEMIIYGSAVNPSININGNEYVVYTTLNADEYLIINSRNNSVIKHTSSGKTEDLYDLRGKTQSVFTKLPAENLKINWLGTFGFDITAYVKRSEPEWI